MAGNQLEIGKIVNTHGVRGEIKVVPWTDDPLFFDDLEWVYVKNGAALDKKNIEFVKYQKNNVILKLKGIETVNDAERLKNRILVTDREVIGPLPQDTYFICDLIGLEVKTEDDEMLGTIDDVMSTGSNDVYIVKDKMNRELLIPALKEVVLEVNLNDEYVIVKLPEGLRE